VPNDQVSACRQMRRPGNLRRFRCFAQDSLGPQCPQVLLGEPFKFPVQEYRVLDLVEAFKNEAEEGFSQ